LPNGLGGRHDVLLGKYGTAASRHEYARAIAEWETNGRRLLQPATPADVTVNELMLAYWKFAEEYYQKNGAPTSQQDRIRLALKPVKQLYGHTPAKNFGPLSLKAVRAWMVKRLWTRGYVNSSVGCIKRMFKWGVEHELVPPSVYHGLQAVSRAKEGAFRGPRNQTHPPRRRRTSGPLFSISEPLNPYSFQFALGAFGCTLPYGGRTYRRGRGA
jgi:hypothetical protein